MNGYSSHTYIWYNQAGEYFWIKLHFIPEQGIQNYTGEEAERMREIDPDVATRDLFEAPGRYVAGGTGPGHRGLVPDPAGSNGRLRTRAQLALVASGHCLVYHEWALPFEFTIHPNA